MDTNGPILWRIVCRVCRWSFFRRIIEKFIFIEKRGAFELGVKGKNHIFFRENSLSSLSFHFLKQFIQQNTTHNRKRQQQQQQQSEDI